MATKNQCDRFRHFNRFYTNYLGLLGSTLYESPVGLSEARILYELDKTPGIHARALRDRLHMDKGQLSRMLKRFVKQGWVQETASENDARMKCLSLTDDGLAFMDELHAKASTQAEKALSALTSTQKKELLAAMSTIEMLLQN